MKTIYFHKAVLVLAWSLLSAGLMAQNVGINTANPTEPLEVSGMIYSSQDGFKFPDGSVQSRASMDFPSTDAGDIRDLFIMDLDQIPGPFSYGDYIDVVHILDLKWGICIPPGGLGGGGGGGILSGDSLIVIKDRDKTTIPLLNALFDQTFISGVDFYYFREDTAQQLVVDYYHMHIVHAIVTSISQFTTYAGVEGYRHLEEVIFRFQEIQIEYEWQDPSMNTQYNFLTGR